MGGVLDSRVIIRFENEEAKYSNDSDNLRDCFNFSKQESLNMILRLTNEINS